MQKEIEDAKEELKAKMINILLDYVRNGIMSKNEPDNFMTCYNIIYNLVDKEMGDELLSYHNEMIEQATKECYEKVKNLTDIEFIDAFITYTERLNTMIFNMSRIFLHISNYYLKIVSDLDGTKKYEQEDVSEFSMEIYKKYFFDKLQNKLFEILKELINKVEKDDNTENKIKAILSIISDLDIVKPKIKQTSQSSIGWFEQSKEKDNKNPYQKKWNDFKG